MKVQKVKERNIVWYEVEVELQRGLTLKKRLNESEIKALRDAISMALKSEEVEAEEV